MSTTSDPSDPRLTRGADSAPTEMAPVYLVLSDAERAKGYVRPLRTTYQHQPCGGVTTMGRSIAETYAANPKFYGSTWCTSCRMHRPVDEFFWVENGQVTTLLVGS